MRKPMQAILLILAACSGGGTGPSGTVNGTFTAVIDGTAWNGSTSQFSTAGGSIPGFQTMGGSKVVSATDYTTITLTLGYLSGPGTYPLGVNHATTAGGLATVSVQQGSTLGVWTTGLTGAAGTLTIATLTSTRMTGTFQFSATPQLGTSATGTKVVTNGMFDLPLASGFSLAPASNHGSKVNATIGGVSWNGASVVALGANGVISMAATTDTLSLSMVTGTVVSTGNSYPVGPGGIQMTVIRTGTSRNWASGTGGSVGTFTVTSLVGNRATGTFSATLVPGATTTGSLVITNGTFDVRIDAP